ncbi:ligand-binding sensor domain-containing diguanylate cyclase [Algicola sagamiensis]|uniref:ligand-binding sensor domain-containing diguanylate cyclase n=1 Tax=Algicola sagamiensis TaxID=163869 RepID=UPI0003A04F35|nr:GGDEF domain-containing protein [Algicola sagamiensis]
MPYKVNRVNHFTFLEDKRIVAATNVGIFVYEVDQWKRLPGTERLNQMPINFIVVSYDQELWFGTLQGMFRWKDGKLRTFPFDRYFESKNMTFYVPDGDNGWVGTTRGAYYYAQAQAQRLGPLLPLYTAHITWILPLNEQELIIATLDDGIFFRNEKEHWIQKDYSDGLPLGAIASLHLDSDREQLWVSSNKGIYRLSLAQLRNENADNVAVENIITPFDHQLGSPQGNCCEGFGLGKVIASKGMVYYPSSQGVMAVPNGEEVVEDVEARLQPIIETVVLGNTKVTPGRKNIIQSVVDARDIQLSFTAVNYTNEELEFRYKLKGLDNDWRLAEEDIRKAMFTHLPAGMYTFLVQAKRPYEFWDNSPASEEDELITAKVKIRIPRKFTESIIYRALLGLLVVFAVYLIIALYRRSHVLRQRALEKLVQQRTQELEHTNRMLNEANGKLKQQSHSDELTGLRSRRYLFEQVPKDVEHFQRNIELMESQGKTIALIYMDLDDFRRINEEFGHVIGDSVIQQFSSYLTTKVRGSDYVVRISGEEFLIVLRDIKVEHVHDFVAGLFRGIQSTRFEIPEDRVMDLTCSMGIGLYPMPLLGGRLINWEVSLNLAEIAMYHAKSSGGNSWALLRFDEQVDAFEFEDTQNIETEVENLLSASLAWFDLRNLSMEEYQNVETEEE